jgi:hypothetical protein
MTTAAEIMFALWIAGFATGYGLRSYLSYRRHQREQRTPGGVTSFGHILTPLENIDGHEAELVPFVRTSPSSLVD